MRTLLLSCLFFIASKLCYANIVINGTRIIYPEKNKEIIVQLINNGDGPSLVQSWIDDGDIHSTPETANSPFLLSPPIVKITENNGQQLSIKRNMDPLPRDIESVYYLNILDIPPTAENLAGMNSIQLAVRSRIKIFFRPKSLAGDANHAIKNLKFNAEEKGIRLINSSPFHINIVSINDPDSKNIIADPVMILPRSNLFASSSINIQRGKEYTVTFIDDLGAYKQHIVTIL